MRKSDKGKRSLKKTNDKIKAGIKEKMYERRERRTRKKSLAVANIEKRRPMPVGMMWLGCTSCRSYRFRFVSERRKIGGSNLRSKGEHNGTGQVHASQPSTEGRGTKRHKPRPLR